jgi:hypothetical protein
MYSMTRQKILLGCNVCTLAHSISPSFTVGLLDDGGWLSLEPEVTVVK